MIYLYFFFLEGLNSPDTTCETCMRLLFDYQNLWLNLFKFNTTTVKQSSLDFAVRSDFSFAIIHKISVTAIFFLISLKLLNFENPVKRLMDCFLLGKYLQANINVTNFISLYLHVEVNLEVVL